MLVIIYLAQPGFNMLRLKIVKVHLNVSFILAADVNIRISWMFYHERLTSLKRLVGEYCLRFRGTSSDSDQIAFFHYWIEVAVEGEKSSSS